MGPSHMEKLMKLDCTKKNFSERGLEDTLENIPDQLIQSRLKKKKNNNHNTRILSDGEDSRMRHKELS